MIHMVFVQITEFDWLPGRQKRLLLEKNVKKNFFSESIMWMKLLLFITAYGIILYINCVCVCFGSAR